MKKYFACFRYDDKETSCYGEVGFYADKLTVTRINELRDEIVEDMNEKENTERKAKHLVFLSFTELEED